MSVSPLNVRPTPVGDASTGCDRAEAITRTLLGYLALAGPLYVIASLAQALTRPGFSVARDEWSLLALGHDGWMQTANLVLTGAMVLAGAVGVRRALGDRTAARRWIPRLIAGYGAGLIVAGGFRADPADRFPAGTPAGPATQLSTHGMLHLVGGSVGFACLIATCLVVGGALHRRGARGQALVSRLVGGLFAVAFAALATGDGSAAVNLAFTAAVIVVSGWLTWLAVSLYREQR